MFISKADDICKVQQAEGGSVDSDPTNMSKESEERSHLDSSIFSFHSDDADSLMSISTPPFSDISSIETASNNMSISYGDHDECDQGGLDSDKYPTFKLVGDNVDKYVKPRHETADKHASSLHYFHVFAVKDRCERSM